MVNPKTGHGKARFYAVWLLIEHPEKGLYLFDTGYSPRFYEATRPFPQRIYRWMTPTHIQPEETAVRQLANLDIRPADLSGIIISHFHADHVAGLLDFPNVPIFCHEAALQQALSLQGMTAVKNGIIKSLLPDDLEKRTTVLPSTFHPLPSTLHPLPSTVFNDFFGDGSLEWILLPGHACGQIGVRINAPDHTLFFAADAAWRKSTLMDNILPSQLVRLFFHDWQAYKTTFASLRAYQQENPKHRLLFTHCPETMSFIA